jgi:hypothetical protein
VFASYNMDLTGEGSTFLFFIFLICYILGEAKVPSQCWLRMLCTRLVSDEFSKKPLMASCILVLSIL